MPDTISGVAIWKKPLGLALILVVLGGGAYWLEFKHRPATEEKEEQNKKLLSLKDQQIAAVKIADGAKVFSFRCASLEAKQCKPGDSAKWDLVEPLKLKADDSNVNSLISSINHLTVNDSISLKEETADKRKALLAEYKLDGDARKARGAKRVEVTLGGGEVRVAYLGDVHPIGDSVFAVMGASAASGGEIAVNEQKVLLIPSHFKSTFEHPLTYWRDKKLLAFATHEVSSFELEGGKANMRVGRKDGQWVIEARGAKGVTYPGDIENVDNLVNSASYLTAKEFVDKKALAGTKKALTLKLELGGEKSADKGAEKSAKPKVNVTRIVFHEKKGKSPGDTRVFAAIDGRDMIYELDGGAKDRFDKTVKDLRLAKLITSMERFTAKKLEFAGAPIGAPALILASRDGKWVLGDAKSEADERKVQELLDRLTGNKIVDFISGSAVPVGEEQGIRFTLGDEKNDRKRQLVFWKHGEKLYARDLLAATRGTMREAFVVDPTVKDSLPWGRDHFTKAPAAAGSPGPGLPGKK